MELRRTVRRRQGRRERTTSLALAHLQHCGGSVHRGCCAGPWLHGAGWRWQRVCRVAWQPTGEGVLSLVARNAHLCVYMHTHTRIHTHTHTLTHARTHTRAHTHTCTDTHQHPMHLRGIAHLNSWAECLPWLPKAHRRSRATNMSTWPPLPPVIDPSWSMLCTRARKSHRGTSGTCGLSSTQAVPTPSGHTCTTPTRMVCCALRCKRRTGLAEAALCMLCTLQGLCGAVHACWGYVALCMLARPCLQGLCGAVHACTPMLAGAMWRCACCRGYVALWMLARPCLQGLCGAVHACWGYVALCMLCTLQGLCGARPPQHGRVGARHAGAGPAGRCCRAPAPHRALLQAVVCVDCPVRLCWVCQGRGPATTRVVRWLHPR